VNDEPGARLSADYSAASSDTGGGSILASRPGSLLESAQGEPPSSDLAKAAGYALNHWEALTQFVKDGRVSPDNNLCEQQLRDIALGRKNYLFAGSHAAARRAANLYSLARTCAQYRVPPLPYFTDTLAKLAAGWPQDRLDELLPHRWRLPEPAAPDPSGP
jgi:hypothetical protein